MKLFSLIQSGDVHFEGEQKIVPAEAFSQMLEVEELIEKAKSDVANYKKQNEEQCAETLEKARKDGFSEGLAQLNDHIVQLDLVTKQLRHELQRQILPIALQAAKKIVGKELETHPETIVDIVIQALTPATQNHFITIYLNKEDREMIENEKQRIKDLLEQVEVLKIEERSDIEQGGCIIKTESGIINAEIENQWRLLEAAFDRYLKEQG